MSKIILDIDTLVEHKLTADQYLFLFCIYTSKVNDLVKYTEVAHKLSREEIINLYVRKFINYDLYVNEECSYNSISQVSKLDLGKISPTLFLEELFKPLISLSIEDNEIIDDFDNFAKTQYEKFPVKVKSGGYLVRSGFEGFKRKLQKIIKSEKLDKEIVDKAFSTYVEEKRRNNWEFMQLASYFISKDGKSTLVSLCEQIIENPNLIEDGGRTGIFTDL